MSDRDDTDRQIGPASHESDESFLARWSRRKQGDQPEQEHPPASSPQPVPARQATPQRELTDADMPPLESLDEKSDYAAFMSPGISETLRKQALRRLFHLPGLHVPDGLDDYDEDFTRFAKLGDVVTREMKRALEREWRAAESPEPEQADIESEAEQGSNDVAESSEACELPDTELGHEATDNGKG